jgi:hypothetical protein
MDNDTLAPAFTYDVVCIDADGNEKWREQFHNLVTTAGRTDLVDKYFRGSSYSASWFLGLKGAGTPNAADTMASHASWSEITAYTSSTLPAISFGAASAGSSTASGVLFNINGTATVAGAFITTNSAKGATTGVLYSAGDFAASRSVVNGDTLTVTPTVSVS